MAWLDDYIAEEMTRYEGVAYPLYSGLLRRLLVKKTACGNLHPNPMDEFCKPEIGPSYRIISEYEQTIREKKGRSASGFFEEPLIVERMSPSGYMLLNGHHRWAAAMRMQIPKVPVKIVNLTQGKDVLRMMERAKGVKRAALDLDEVILRTEGEDDTDQPLSWPFRRVYPERLRRGTAALLHFLREHGYDIWLYSAGYHSMEHMRRLFIHYHVNLAGIVTGLTEKRPGAEEVRKALGEGAARKYTRTVHIDDRSVICIDKASRSYREYGLQEDGGNWSTQIMEFIREFEKESVVSGK